MLDNGLVNVPQYNDEQDCRVFQAQSLGFIIGPADWDELCPISLLGSSVLLHAIMAVGDPLRGEFKASFLGRLDHPIFIKFDRISLGGFCDLRIRSYPMALSLYCLVAFLQPGSFVYPDRGDIGDCVRATFRFKPNLDFIFNSFIFKFDGTVLAQPVSLASWLPALFVSYSNFSMG